MEAEKCLNCSGETEKGYRYCLDCYKRYQAELQHEQEQKKEGAVYKKILKEKEQDVSFKGISGLIDAVKELNKGVGALNNNVYALRFIEEYKLKEKKKQLIWNKKKANKKGDFEIKGL